jgi:hypothetical protein
MRDRRRVPAHQRADPAMSAVESGGTFSPFTEITTLPSSPMIAVLTSVSCIATGQCVGVGNYTDNTNRSSSSRRSCSGPAAPAACHRIGCAAGDRPLPPALLTNAVREPHSASGVHQAASTVGRCRRGAQPVSSVALVADKTAYRGEGYATFRGSRSVRIAPRWGAFAASIVPLWFRSKRAAMVSPRPAPSA